MLWSLCTLSRTLEHWSSGCGSQCGCIRNITCGGLTGSSCAPLRWLGIMHLAVIGGSILLPPQPLLPRTVILIAVAAIVPKSHTLLRTQWICCYQNSLWLFLHGRCGTLRPGLRGDSEVSSPPLSRSGDVGGLGETIIGLLALPPRKIGRTRDPIRKCAIRISAWPCMTSCTSSSSSARSTSTQKLLSRILNAFAFAVFHCSASCCAHSNALRYTASSGSVPSSTLGGLESLVNADRAFIHCAVFSLECNLFSSTAPERACASVFRRSSSRNHH